MNRGWGVFVLSAVFALAGCGATPAKDQAAADEAETSKPAEVPELTLNLPSDACECGAREEQPDRTFLERGLDALVTGNHIDAVQYFQRYQRIEKSDQAAWEAGIAIAYVSMLPSSPFYDPQEAALAYRRLADQYNAGMQPHTKILLMRESLQTFVAMDRHVNELKNRNSTLREDLVKRERALKRLRELTLGQPEEPQ